MQSVKDAMHETSGSSGISNKVEHDKKAEPPRYDLPDHLITSRRALGRGPCAVRAAAATAVIPSIAQGNLETYGDHLAAHPMIPLGIPR